ncbi:hypothetical protein BY996DRAFT_6479828 [Phakopsora pachyrhizi]|nr:hypothetical protein BY996DRAFT_6605426 [Phakopsora pachyrhizi]KAI8449924.1 hypothetical protein BY996DRAFT_6479828 [Phakopsora pachyrhizi]
MKQTQKIQEFKLQETEELGGIKQTKLIITSIQNKPDQQNDYWPETTQGFRTFERPSSQDYNDFIEYFSIILKYLIEDGQIIDEDEAFKLIKQGNLQRYNNGEYLMPPISIIKILIEKEIKFMRMLDSGSYRTTTLIDNTYIEGKQGIQNQLVNKNKEEETSTNQAGPLDKESKESTPTASTDHYPTREILKNSDQENQLVIGNSQQLEEDIYQEQQQELQLPTRSLSGDSINQAKNKGEETIYLVEDIVSVMNDLPGYRLMDEDFGLILPSITADKFFYDLWIEGREKVIKNDIGQWIYFDVWVPGIGTQPGLSDSGSGKMDQSWEPIKEQVKLGSSVQTQESINEENLEENEERQLQLKEITDLSCTINTVKMNNICPVTFRIWNQEPKEPDPGEEEKKVQLHVQKGKNILETNYKINKNQDKAKIKEVGGGALEKQNQTTKKIIEEETVMKTPGGQNQQQKHFGIMSIYKSVLNKFKSLKQETSQNPHSPLIKAPNLRNPFIGTLTKIHQNYQIWKKTKNHYQTNRTNISIQEITVFGMTINYINKTPVLEEYDEDSSNLPLDT